MGKDFTVISRVVMHYRLFHGIRHGARAHSHSER